MSVKVISHRGANKVAPQNTLPAFEKSLEIGVDGFETDVHITADGHPIICHNYEINKTSNGKGTISKMTLEQIKQYDFGSYFGKDFEGVKAPTLEEFLTLCENAEIEILNIELKPSKENDMTVVKKTIDMVKDFCLFDKLIISSFSSKMLVEAKKYDRNCRTAYLYSPDKRETYSMWYRAAEFGKEIGVSALHPHKCFVSKSYVKKAHDLGIKVNVWTPDKDSDFKRLIKCGVDGLITDCPEIANECIKKYAE